MISLRIKYIVFFKFLLLICLSITDLKAEDNYTNSATLQALDKVSTNVSNLKISINEKINFGNLEIQMFKCFKAPIYEKPESKALLKISEIIEDKKTQIFYGWMFKSSPSLNSLEHPIYDITLISCDSKNDNNISN